MSRATPTQGTVGDDSVRNDADTRARAASQSLWVNRYLLLAALLTIPVLLPFDAAWQWIYSSDILLPVMLVGLIAIILPRMRESEDAREAWFWGLLAAGFAAWTLVAPLRYLADWLVVGETSGLSSLMNLPHLFSYGFLVAAMLMHPHAHGDRVILPLRMLEWSGTVVLFLGLLLYLLVVPAMQDGRAQVFWRSQLAIWLALDLYLIVWLWYLRSVADQPGWRATYGWYLVAAAVWGVGDLALLLVNQGWLPAGTVSAPFELLWLISCCAMAMSTRIDLREQNAESMPVHFKSMPGLGSLVAYTSLPLFLHTGWYRWGAQDMTSQVAHESVALGVTVVLTGITLFYFRLVRQENARLSAEEAHAREALAHRAFHDQLTELPNRNLFNDRLHMAVADAVRNQRKCAVLFCDLDQFKAINDSLGHGAGDQTLSITARRLRTAVRQQDTVARLGGDEFAVLLTGITDTQDAAHLAQKLLTTISEPMEIAGKSHVMTASIGVAVYPDDGASEKEILKHADTAMYQSKIHGRNTYRLFTDAMNVAARERLVIEQGLRNGLLEDQFAVLFQPIYSLSTGDASGYEALVRWRDPEHGYISPEGFIDVAEQTGLIVPIGHWVLETACKWAVGLAASGGQAPLISVNMSPRQLREPDVVPRVAAVLEKTGLPANRLQLEVTESAVLSVEACRTAMADLRSLGLRIAIDDFGTGYSALSRLGELPVDAIKIDRSFVQRIDGNSVSEAIVKAIVSMADAMGVQVVAEGVETESELAVIRDAGCDSAQGYYFCKPLTAEELKVLGGGGVRQEELDLLSGTGDDDAGSRGRARLN